MNDPAQADVVICGAGIAGIAAAWALSARGQRQVVLVDDRPPMTLTSDKSTEAYRNWWPAPDGAMIELMNRSIDWLEQLAAESGNAFLLNRRGYLYATKMHEHVDVWRLQAERAQAFGAGRLRIHDRMPGSGYRAAPAEGFADQPDGADLLLSQGLIRQEFPFLSEEAVAVLHTRRCGWFSGQQLGMYLLQKARDAGAEVLQGRVTGVGTGGGRVDSVHVQTPARSLRLATGAFINAAGPDVGAVAELLGVELPVFSELHLKMSFPDAHGALPRTAPMVIGDDELELDWDPAEVRLLRETGAPPWLMERLPAGVHTRPEGGHGSQNVLLLWPNHLEPVQPRFPLPDDPFFPEVALRGMAAWIPGFRTYINRLPRPYIDGGYYTKTVENRPLIGPLPVEGAYVVGALSGFGLMAACAAGELVAAHVLGERLPSYAPAFRLERYDDPAYQARLKDWGSSAQL